MFKKYDVYIDSDVQSVGKIPADWSIGRLGAILEPISKKGNADKPLLSITREKGVILRDLENDSENHNFIPDDLSNYKLIEKGQFGMNKMKAWQGSYGVSPYTGIVSPAYYVFKFIKPIYPEFFHWAIRSKTYIAFFASASDGVRIGQWDLSKDRMKNIPFIYPDIQIQKKIVDFIELKVKEINKAIEINKQQIVLLNERKQSVIENAVTQGLDPNAPMKDLGVEWIGRIPQHWHVKKAKYLFKEVDERSVNGNEELLSVSHLTGVTPRSEKNISMFMAEDYSGSKLCKKNDLVINIMWAWMGALGVSAYEGIVSPSYGVYRLKKVNSFNSLYLEYLLKTTKYIEHYNKVSTGLHSSRLRFYSHMFFDMKIGFPPLEEQNQIIDSISQQTYKIDEALGQLYCQIEKLKEYKTTLINDAVTGKIKVA